LLPRDEKQKFITIVYQQNSSTSRGHTLDFATVGLLKLLAPAVAWNDMPASMMSSDRPLSDFWHSSTENRNFSESYSTMSLCAPLWQFLFVNCAFEMCVYLFIYYYYHHHHHHHRRHYHYNWCLGWLYLCCV